MECPLLLCRLLDQKEDPCASCVDLTRGLSPPSRALLNNLELLAIMSPHHYAQKRVQKRPGDPGNPNHRNAGSCTECLAVRFDIIVVDSTDFGAWPDKSGV